MCVPVPYFREPEKFNTDVAIVVLRYQCFPFYSPGDIIILLSPRNIYTAPYSENDVKRTTLVVAERKHTHIYIYIYAGHPREKNQKISDIYIYIYMEKSYL